MAQVMMKQKRKKRVEQGHPWIFGNEIEQITGEAEPGQLVHVYNHHGHFLATGYYNPHSQIRVRVISYEPLQEMDAAFFETRIREAKRLRERFLPDQTSFRAVYGEADFLPGLVVDKFADVLVVQILSMGMEAHREILLKAFVNVYEPKGIYERSDVPVRELEGLEQRTGLLYGTAERWVEIEENGIPMQVDIEQGQKTGYFFDQRENRAFLQHLVRGWGERSGIQLQEMEIDGDIQSVPVNKNGKVVQFPYWDGATVLECFAHTGSFTLHACQYGAKKVTCLDVSAHAIETAKQNVQRNGFEDRVEFVVEDAFEYLRRHAKVVDEKQRRARLLQQGAEKVDTSKPLTEEGRTWDVVILDPPAFAKNRKAIESACRGYKDINLHGMKLVNEGGYLVTASCSFHVAPDVFLATIEAAAVDAGKQLRLIHFDGAGKDHPRIQGVDEGHYLKFAVFEVRTRK
ncbi:class I SAM-dependent rRNA methyltransferase [Marinicrinis sediminis]|uniref:Class I SAM-dependent rRNA methyltransferase n=1 Tax=Marinicrinis sediminis TaxID=1652465 RepID=A0ABW5RBH9_9BACL